MAETLVQALRRAADSERSGAGLRFLDRRERETWLDWATVRDRAARAAGVLQRSGVRPGDRVAIVLPTGPAFMDAFFGALWAGAVPTPLYPPVRLGRLDEYRDRTVAMLRVSRAVALVSDRRVRRVLGQVMARVEVVSVAADALGEGAPVDPVPRDPEDLALVQFSSGTTVAPKAVALSHRAVLANARAILDFMPEPLPVGVSWLPLYHDMGLIGCVVPAVLGPGQLTLIPPEVFLSRPGTWLRAISRYKAIVSPAPDFAYSLCAERVRDEELEGCDLSSWRLALDGAEPISPANTRRFSERFARYGLSAAALTPVYGLSEAALAVTFSDPARPVRTLTLDREALGRGQVVPAAEGVRLVSVGRPLRGYAVEVRGEDGRPTEGVGRVWVRGPSLLSRYLGTDESPVVEGWLDTGDVGFTTQGELVLTGRARELIILRGQNHLPQDIERAVDEVPGVRTGCAAAVGQRGPDGERLVVMVEVRGETHEEGLAEACRRAVLARTGLDPALVLTLAPGTLPRTSSGKIRRSEALSRWESGTLLPPASLTPWRMAGVLASSALGHLGVRR